jgi:hypothetical protein
MLNPSEKAYCQALLALKGKDYQTAQALFDEAAANFKDNQEFNMLRDVTTLLIEVRKELGGLPDNDRLEIKEVFSNG